MKKSIRDSVALTKKAEERWGLKRKWRCVYCGRGTGLQVDHFEPTAMGGGDDIWNLMPACDRCNASKNGLDPWGWMEVAGVPLARQSAIMRVRRLPATARLDVPPDRFELDYDAVRRLKRSVRAS